MTAFEKAVEETLGFEGGFAHDPTDPGGASHWGISEEIARDHGYTGSLDTLPLSQAISIYRVDYWDKNQLEEVSHYSERIASHLFDAGVTLGAEQAATMFHRAINCLSQNEALFPALAIDGIITSKTMSTLSRLGRHSDKLMLLKILRTIQGERYVQLSEQTEMNHAILIKWFQRIAG